MFFFNGTSAFNLGHVNYFYIFKQSLLSPILTQSQTLRQVDNQLKFFL